MLPVYFADTIFVSFPDASNNNVGDHTNDRGNDQHRQELAHGLRALQTQEQRKPILRYSLLARRSARTRAPLNRDHGVVRSWSDSDQIVAVPRMSALCSRLNRSTQHFIVEEKDRECRTIGQ
jgi:hypothetical protein